MDDVDAFHGLHGVEAEGRAVEHGGGALVGLALEVLGDHLRVADGLGEGVRVGHDGGGFADEVAARGERGGGDVGGGLVAGDVSGHRMLLV